MLVGWSGEAVGLPWVSNSARRRGCIAAYRRHVARNASANATKLFELKLAGTVANDNRRIRGGSIRLITTCGWGSANANSDNNAIPTRAATNRWTYNGLIVANAIRGSNPASRQTIFNNGENGGVSPGRFTAQGVVSTFRSIHVSSAKSATRTVSDPAAG